MSSVIEVDGVRKSFKDKDILKGVELRVEEGMIVGLLGANGAGKSTLMKCLLGLLRPTSGACRVFGEDSWSLSETAKARLGYAAQQPKLHCWMLARHVAEYVGAFYPRWDAAFVKELFEQWHVDSKSLVATMSGGELQKLGLILALGHRPELLVLDEPASALDPIARREVLKTLRNPELSARTVLFSSHILSDLEQVATHIALLQDGRVTLFEECSQLTRRAKRVRPMANQDLPQSMSHPSALSTQVKGPAAVLTFLEVDEPLLSELGLRWQCKVSVEAMSLEEIFLELHHVASA